MAANSGLKSYETKSDLAVDPSYMLHSFQGRSTYADKRIKNSCACNRQRHHHDEVGEEGKHAKDDMGPHSEPSLDDLQKRLRDCNQKNIPNNKDCTDWNLPEEKFWRLELVS
jgi:hypothetical protein